MLIKQGGAFDLHELFIFPTILLSADFSVNRQLSSQPTPRVDDKTDETHMICAYTNKYLTQ
jgi:hypothetical protein